MKELFELFIEIICNLGDDFDWENEYEDDSYVKALRDKLPNEMTAELPLSLPKAV